MKRTTLTLVAAVTAAALSLTACGTDSDPGGGDASGGGGTIASQLLLGGPPEFQTRPDGVPGLKETYGVEFEGYKVLDTGGPLTVTALKNGQVDAADLFTTDPAIEANDFVALEDPESNFAAQNVLPLINKEKATDGVKEVLNLISSKLTTDVLIQLRTSVETNKQDPDAVAKEFLGTLDLPTTTPAAGSTIKVGSANFPENVVLAQIYAEALKGAGATVTTQLNIGSRETYIPALEDGSIDLIPEYSGTLLQYFDKEATATSSDDVFAALPDALPATLTVTEQSEAQDADAIVVTKETADKYNLKTIADLAKTS